ncbi:MAG: hypothetical protein JJU12_04790 [Chlamydiales bacterium]|nr:hypothetical protein [Chlamydiales bacterium]
MKKNLIALFLFPLLAFGYQPEVALGELFVDVQMERTFPDSKTFVDAVPICCPEDILRIYKSECPANLQTFLKRYFTLPKEPPPVESTGLTMREYLMSMWDQLQRSSLKACCEITTLLPLPRPYIVSGDRFREMYYWDSFFAMLGLSLSGRDQLMEGMLIDFAYLIDLYGFIPNGNRSYYLSRSQPPFFSLMVLLSDSPETYLSQLEKEYSFWMTQRYVLSTQLNQYSDACWTPRPESYREDICNASLYPEERRAAYYHNVRATAESGWDFSSRWLDEEGQFITTHLIEVDLNCLLYHQEALLADLYSARGCTEKAFYYRQQAERRRAAIQEYFWDDERQYFFDYDFVKGKRTPHFTLAGVFPLLFNLATEEQAESVARTLRERFLYPGGLVTTLVETDQQWDYPNGWPPLQWVAVCGLRNYGYLELASEIVRRWLKVNDFEFALTGQMLEKYNVVDPEKLPGEGEYPLQRGFGWTNGVALYFYEWTPNKKCYRMFEQREAESRSR